MAKTPPSSPSKLRELAPGELRWSCDPSKYDLSIPGTARSVGIIGQDRAIKAMKMGIELYSPGYNIFVCGITGTGRTTTVKQILDNIKSSCPLPQDRCFVHNFSDPSKPRLIVLGRGRAGQLKKDMDKLIRKLAHALPRVFEATDHLRKRERIVARHEHEADKLIEKFDGRAEKEGFALKRVREGNIIRTELYPTIGDQAVGMGDLPKLVEEKKLSQKQAREIHKRYAALQGDLESIAKQAREILEKMEGELAVAEKAAIRQAIEGLVKPLAGRYENGAVRAHFDEAIEHLVESSEIFSPKSSAPELAAEGGPEAVQAARESLLSLLDVNVLLDNKGREPCPVIIENLPTYRRLFGYFDKSMDQSGHWTSDFRQIRAGSLLRADGGYLVLNAEQALAMRGVWPALKRTLVKRALEVYEEGTPLQAPTTHMTPEPVPVNVKVILIGDRETYSKLYNNDTDFKKIFKVLADFDYEMDLNKKNLRQYAAFVGKMCHEEGLGPFDPGAVGAVAEYGARKAGRKGKLTARFGDISDLLREADYLRRKDGQPKVLARHVKSAVRDAVRRNGLWEEKLTEMVTSGMIRVNLKGSEVGQITGLQIRDLGYHAFGLPARITATAAPGTAGIINIEREAQLAGRSYNKGVLIIGGYFREKFGASRPVTFTASLAFEQSYGGVDGDSASAAEIFALLSALTGVPLDQAIAVTGSVDQKGLIQPVGGINLKIEGYFRVCKSKGLSGRHGVAIPEQNVEDLMLDDDVVEAVRRKKFHIYPISTVEQGIELLSGIPAGQTGKDGAYPDGTIYGLVAKRLAAIAQTVQRFPPGGKTV